MYSVNIPVKHSWDKVSEDFCYLGKLYNFEINASDGAKEFITNKLKTLLSATNKLKVRPQTKLKILKLYIHSQLVFYFKAYDLPSTWIENALDAPCVQYVRGWLETSISSCVSEMQRLPVNRTGLGIPSFKEVAEKISLKKRHAMKNGQSSVAQQIWSETSSKHVATDELINKSASLRAASIELTQRQTQDAWSHVQSLTVQGISVTSIVDNIPKKNITAWSKTLSIRAGFRHWGALRTDMQGAPPTI